MVVLVHDVHVVFGVDGDTGGTVELAGVTAEGAPFAEECPRHIENRNAMVVLISDVQSLLAVKGHSHRPGELPVARARAITELSQVLLIQSADAHPDGGGTRRVAAVQYEDAPISADGDIIRVGKAAPVVAIVHNADGLDVLQRNAWCSGLNAHSSPPFPASLRVLQHPRTVAHQRVGSIDYSGTSPAQSVLSAPPGGRVRTNLMPVGIPWRRRSSATCCRPAVQMDRLAGVP